MLECDYAVCITKMLICMVFNDVIYTGFNVKNWRYYTVIVGPNNRLTGNGKNRVGNTIQDAKLFCIICG
jgi:hypothetical protein